MPQLEEIPAWLKEQIRFGDLVLTLGAGDVWKVGEQLMVELSGSAGASEMDTSTDVQEEGGERES